MRRARCCSLAIRLDVAIVNSITLTKGPSIPLLMPQFDEPPFLSIVGFRFTVAEVGDVALLLLFDRFDKICFQMYDESRKSTRRREETLNGDSNVARILPSD